MSKDNDLKERLLPGVQIELTSGIKKL